jgi:branched-chain amino acid transport system permease protein
LDFGLTIQILFGGLGIGIIYSLVGMGYSMIYRSMGLVNFAHGSIFMIGAYMGLVFYVTLKFPFPIAFCLGILSTAIIGFFLERILRPLSRIDLMFMLIGTLALGIVFDNLALIIWGAEGLPFPAPLGEKPLSLGTLLIEPQTILILIISPCIVVLLQLFMQRSKTGKAMRAAAQDRETAGAMGISLNRVNALSMAIGSALAAVAGILAAPVFLVSTNMGWSVAVKGFAAAILGGFGNPIGAVVGGIMFGMIEALSAFFISSTYKYTISFVVTIIVLMFKPTGIFGEPTIEKM